VTAHTQSPRDHEVDGRGGEEGGGGVEKEGRKGGGGREMEEGGQGEGEGEEGGGRKAREDHKKRKELAREEVYHGSYIHGYRYIYRYR